MNPRKIAIQELEAEGYRLVRNAKHAIYYSDETKAIIPVRWDFDDQDLKVIRAEIRRAKRVIGE